MSFLIAGTSFGVKSEDRDVVVRAAFNPDGSVNLPIGYRNWTHVGTRIKSIGINILDGLPTKGPSCLTLMSSRARWPSSSERANGRMAHR